MGVIVLNTTKNPTIVNDIAHENIHNKNMFDWQKIFFSVADDDYIYLSLRPQTKEMHLIVTIEAEGKAIFKSYSDTTWTADGTEGDTFNRYINDAPDADSKIYYGGIVDTLGDQRFDKLILGGTGPRSTGSTSSDRIESVLQPLKELTIAVQNISGLAKDFGMSIEWYEVQE